MAALSGRGIASALPGRHPQDVLGAFRDRLELRRDGRSSRPEGVQPCELEEALNRIAAPASVDDLLSETAFVELERELDRRAEQGQGASGYPVDMSASRALARTAYVAVRARRPETVVEVGVASGLSTAYITAALEANGAGHLHSIDPVMGTPEQMRSLGWLVPERLEHRCSLHRGRSRRLLRPLLRKHRPQVVLLDGLHTEPTMRWEIERAAAALAGRAGVLLVDDAESNTAFAGWGARAAPAWWSLVKTEYGGHLFGAARPG